MLFMASIIYYPSQERRADDPEDLQPAHAALEHELRQAGQYVAGAGLYPAQYYARRLVKDGEAFRVTDGPFAEAKEAIGGFFMFECENLDAATDIARRIPVDSRSFVEVRRVGIWSPPE
jgi:hypothetical protein